MREERKISVACAADDKYAVLAATLLKSIELSTDSDVVVDAYVLSNGISKRRRKMLLDSVDPAKVRVVFLFPSEENMSLLRGIRNFRGLTAFHRLLLPDLLPENLDRLIYLDCDILVLQSLVDLWNVELGSRYICAAVRDRRVWSFSGDWDGSIPNWKELGFEADTQYFNSGVLLIDLTSWRSEQITELVVKCTIANWSHVRWLDQYGLNVVLANRWRELDLEWNSFPEHSEVADRRIIHFVGRNPNEADYDGPYKSEFLQIMDQTAWAGKRPSTLPLKLAPMLFVPLARLLLPRLKRLVSPW